jgi:hypothetical protein
VRHVLVFESVIKMLIKCPCHYVLCAAAMVCGFRVPEFMVDFAVQTNNQAYQTNISLMKVSWIKAKAGL